MDAIDYIMSVEHKLNKYFISDEERLTAEYSMRTLSTSELERLMSTLSRGDELYDQCDKISKYEVGEPLSYYDPQTYKPFRHKTESFNCLLKWARDRVKGKLSYAKKTLKLNFDGYSYSQQVKILKILLTQAPGDRAFAFQKLFSLWDDHMKDDIVECWNQFHDSECARLITRFFPMGFIKDNLKELSLPRNYYTLCRRIGKELWFKPEKEMFPESVTIKSYLEAMSYTQYPISPTEAREILFRIISVAIHSILLNKPDTDHRDEISMLTMGCNPTMSNYFLVGDCSFLHIPYMAKILACLCRMGLFKTVEEFIAWDNSLREYYTRLKRIIPPSYYRNSGVCFIDTLSIAWFLFPEDLTYMLDYSSYAYETRLNSNWDILLNSVPRKNGSEKTFKLEDKLRILKDDDFDWIPVRELSDQKPISLDSNAYVEQSVGKKEISRLYEANPTLNFNEDILSLLSEDPFKQEESEPIDIPF